MWVYLPLKVMIHFLGNVAVNGEPDETHMPSTDLNDPDRNLLLLWKK